MNIPSASAAGQNLHSAARQVLSADKTSEYGISG